MYHVYVYKRGLQLYRQRINSGRGEAPARCDALECSTGESSGEVSARRVRAADAAAAGGACAAVEIRAKWGSERVGWVGACVGGCVMISRGGA